MSPDGPEEDPDLRHTEHQQRDVRLRRDLSADGHLARGDHTRMSRLNFSARARPRDDGERDPVFTERDAASAAPPAPDPAPATDAKDDSLLQRVGKLFGL